MNLVSELDSITQNINASSFCGPFFPETTIAIYAFGYVENVTKSLRWFVSKNVPNIILVDRDSHIATNQRSSG